MVRPLCRLAAPCALALALAAPPLAAQPHAGPPPTAPVGWRWQTDAPGRPVATPDSVAGGADRFWFVAMPPGFHVTMGPGGVLHHPAVTTGGRFTVESEVFCFPETGDAVEYGVAIGAPGADGRGAWIAFVLRGDGQAAIVRRGGGDATPVRDWRPTATAVARRAGTAVRNTLRVVAGDTSVTFLVNGAEVARVARRGLALDGVVGLRAGAGANLHVTSLDVTRHAAPARP